MLGYPIIIFCFNIKSYYFIGTVSGFVYLNENKFEEHKLNVQGHVNSHVQILMSGSLENWNMFQLKGV